MKLIIFGVFSFLLLALSSTFAQIPNPVADIEIRDESSLRRRSLELERVKREGNTINPAGASKEQQIKFAQVKADFESIQNLQTAIIKAYTTGKRINYEKIHDSAAEMTNKARRLDENLFGAKQNQKIKVENAKQKSIRDLIIELDNSIGKFVSSPIFKDTKLVDLETSQKTRIDLEKLLTLSEILSKEAGKMK